MSFRIDQGIDGTWSLVNKTTGNTAISVAVDDTLTLATGGTLSMTRAALAATGTNAATAAVIATQVVAVTASDGTKAVALPAAATTTGPILVINTVTTATLPVFPISGGNDNINAGAEDAAFTLGAGKAAWFVPTSTTQWYAQDASAATATTTELNYVDIATLGTLAASKAWTSDANLDTIMPTGGLLTVQSGGQITTNSGSTLEIGGTLNIATVAVTASAAELNYNDIATLGTLAASKSWTSDASLDTVMPTGGLLTVQSGGAITLNSGSTLTVNGTTAATAAAAEHGAGAIGTAAAPATYRWTDRGVIVTQTKIDLTGLASVATANDVIGLSAGGVAYIGRNVVATNGVIFKVEFSCIETPAGGDNDVNVVANSSAVLAYDGAGGTTYLSNSGDLLAGQTIQNLVPALTEGDYFYLTAGTGDTAAAYTAGMYILTTYGHAALA